MSNEEPEHTSHGIPDQLTEELRRIKDEARETSIPEPLLTTLQDTIKSPARSKTLHVQAATLLLMVIPQVRDFVSNNPVGAVAAITALNTLVRFATSGKVSIFSGGAENGRRSGGGRNSTLWLPVFVIATAITGLCVVRMSHTGHLLAI